MLSLGTRRRRNTRKGRKARTSYPIYRRFPTNRAMFNPTNPYSDSFVHHFVRYGSYARLGINADGSVPYLLEDSNVSSGQWNIASVTSDVSGPYTGLGQFPMTYHSKLSSVINAANLANLFAQFRIDKIELTVKLLNGPSFGQGSAGSPVTGVLPEWFVKFDPDDSLMPPNFEAVAQSANCLSWDFSQKTSHTYSFVPQTAALVTGQPASAGTGLMHTTFRSAWYDTNINETATEFCGLKIWIRNFQNSLGQTALFSMEPKYFMSFRRPN